MREQGTVNMGERNAPSPFEDTSDASDEDDENADVDLLSRTRDSSTSLRYYVIGRLLLRICQKWRRLRILAVPCTFSRSCSPYFPSSRQNVLDQEPLNSS